MSVPIFLFDPVPAPPDYPRDDRIESLCRLSTSSKDSDENLLDLPSSPDISPFGFGSSSKGKARKRLMDVFKSKSNSPGPLIISSPLKESMDVDNLPKTPTRASKSTFLNSSPMKVSSSRIGGPVDVENCPSTPSRAPRPRAMPPAPRNNPKYDSHLEKIIESIMADCTSSARQVASSTLVNLATIIEIAANTARVRQELWEMSLSASKKIAYAKPDVSTAVTACLFRALVEINSAWNVEMEKSVSVKTPKELSSIAGWTVQKLLDEREGAGIRLGKAFTFWVKAYGSELKATSSGSNKQVIRILTLGNSASVYTAIMALLVHLPTAHVHLTILEYRPRFDGAELATNLLTEVYSASEDLRLHVCVVPDCAMASIVTATNVLLLSADYIAANGNVCSKMGSLAAAICVKKLQPNSKVVIIGDGDKIGPMRPGELSTECHSVDVITKGWSRCTKEALQIVKDKIEIFTDSQEWVPKDLIDVYVTDSGLMDAEQLASYVEDISNLETALFG